MLISHLSLTKTSSQGSRVILWKEPQAKHQKAWIQIPVAHYIYDQNKPFNLSCISFLPHQEITPALLISNMVSGIKRQKNESAFFLN